MDTILVCLQVLILIGIGSIFLFRRYLFSYSSEKGKNLATKEDIGEITRKVESTKSEYISNIERLKVDLLLIAKKNDVLFSEKIRVFKKLQKRLVNFKKYCEAAIGTYDDRGEFHPNLEVLDENIDKATLQHITALHQIASEDFIFFSKHSKNVLGELQDRCSLMCSMEIGLYGNPNNFDLIKSSIPVYEAAMINIDECLQSLYDELEFPSKED